MENNYIGRYLQIDTHDGRFEGIVQLIDYIHDKKIVLRKVKDCSTGEMMREHHFFSDQIKDIRFLDDKNKNFESEQNETTNLPSEGLVYSAVNGHVKPLVMDSSDAGSSLIQLDNLLPFSYLSGNVSSMLFPSHLNEPPSALLVDKLDNKFSEAISFIQSQRVISFAMEGYDISRFGDSHCLVIIGTRQMVYIFDVFKLGSQCFSDGLAAILEDINLLKVIHDVRMPSDYLYSLYRIQPKNIFDTQVADCFIYKQEHGDFPDEVSSLTDCVIHYLMVDAKECLFEKIKNKMIKNNRNIWTNRPFDIQFLKVCAKTGMYLRELRTVMLQKLLAEFLCGVDIYLESVRSLNESASRYVNNRKLPKEFSQINVCKQKRFEKNHHILSLKEHSFKNDSSNVDNIGYQGNQRSIWDTGAYFNEKYKEKHGEIVECMDSKKPLIDQTKPLLRSSRNDDGIDHCNNAPINTEDSKPTPVSSPQAEIAAKIISNLKIDHTISPKIHYRESTEKYSTDEYQMSMSDSDDPDFFLTSVNDKENIHANIDKCFENIKKQENHVPAANNDKPSTHIDNKSSAKINNKIERPTISDASKRMLRQTLQVAHKSQRCHPPSSDDPDEYPSLHISNKISPTNRRNKKLLASSSISSPLVQKETKQKVIGRGQILKYLSDQSQHSSIGNIPGTKQLSSLPPRTFSTEPGVYDFPSDEELLETPHVSEMVGGVIAGEEVSVLKKFAS